MFFRQGSGKNRWIVAGATACLVLGYALYLPPVLGEKGDTVYVTRNFFGVKKVMDTTAERKLLHGDTLHGMESRDPAMAGQPMIYYHREGPLGDVMEMMRDRPNQHVGVIGLGAGSIAAYAGPNRHVTFFEIDPEVEAIAARFFTFLDRCGNHCDVVSGDGRLADRARSGTPVRSDRPRCVQFGCDTRRIWFRVKLSIVYLSRLKPDGASSLSRVESIPESEGSCECTGHRSRTPVSRACRQGRRATGKSDSTLCHCSEDRRRALGSLQELGHMEGGQRAA